MPCGSIYDKDTGEILSLIETGELSSFELNSEDCEVIEGFYDSDEYYIKDGAAVKRPEMNASIDKTVMTNLPVPCSVEVSNIGLTSEELTSRRIIFDTTTYEVDDGSFEYDCLYPGMYKVKVRSFPYIPWEGVITVEGDL